MSNKMNRILQSITIILTLVATSSYAQGDKYKKTALQNITGSQFIHYYTRFSGSPFLIKDWVDGDVTMKSGEVYSDLQLRYDAYRDELIYFNTVNNNAIIIDKNTIVGFTLKPIFGDTEHFEPMYADELHGLSGRYMAILLKDSISVIRKYEAKEDTYNTPSGNGKSAEFVHQYTTYTWNGRELSIVPKRRGAIFKQYPAHKDELRKFCFQHHIRMKDKKSVVLLYTKINELIKADSQAKN